MRERARLTNWDLLRSLAMLFVVVVHCAATLGPIHGLDTRPALSEFFLMCDPVFFCLSGYFALRPHKGDLGTYYLRKVSSIIIPIILYAVLLFFWGAWRGTITDVTLRGFASYQNDLLQHDWWFMPELIPFLILAPFLARMLDALDDRMLRTLAIVVAVLAGWGCLSMFCVNVLTWAQMTTKSTFVSIAMQLLPASLIPHSRYFVFFVMGYFVRRLSSSLSSREFRAIVALGAFAWVMDALLKGLGFDRQDPSYWWLYTTFAIFVIFDRIRIESPAAIGAITWTAKRSYSIYLVQFTAIAFLKPHLYDAMPFGDVAAMPVGGRIGVWCLLVIGSYLISLAVVSIIDPTVLKLLQAAWTKAVVAPHQRRMEARHSAAPRHGAEK